MLCPECLKRNVDGAKKCCYCGHYFEFRNRFKYIFFNQFVIGLFSGAVLLLAGQTIERFTSISREIKAEKLEHEELKNLLQSEFDKNYFVLAHNDEWLKKNKGWLEKEVREKGSLENATVVIIDLKRLKFNAWNKVESNSVFLKYTDQQKRTIGANLYSELEHIDLMIQNREEHRISNSGKPWVANTIKNLDNNLMIKIEEIKPSVMEWGDYLFSNKKWRNQRKKLLW